MGKKTTTPVSGASKNRIKILVALTREFKIALRNADKNFLWTVKSQIRMKDKRIHALEKEIKLLRRKLADPVAGMHFRFPLIENEKVLQMGMNAIMPVPESLTPAQRRIRTTVLKKIDSQYQLHPAHVNVGTFTSDLPSGGPRWLELDRKFGKMGAEMVRQALNHFGVGWKGRFG